jgi:hypothetical protein
MFRVIDILPPTRSYALDLSNLSAPEYQTILMALQLLRRLDPQFVRAPVTPNSLDRLVDQVRVVFRHALTERDRLYKKSQAKRRKVLVS